MRLELTSHALCLVAGMIACAGVPDENPDARSGKGPAPAEVANPMTDFARLLPGE